MKTKPTDPTSPSDLTPPVRTGWNSNHPIQRFFAKTVSALALAAAGLAQAGTLQTDFSSDPGGIGNVNRPGIMTLLTNSQLTLINLQDVLDEFGVFQPSRLPLQASYVFPEIDPGSRVESFTATFKVRMGGGTDSPAQGFCLVLANDYDGSLFREAGGTTTGLTISFDTYNSEAPGPGIAGATEGNVPGDAPGIIIKQGGGPRFWRNDLTGCAPIPPVPITPPFSLRCR